jgi:xanthine/CO dehydrogenase XdhC/CoxF family maturation factor
MRELRDLLAAWRRLADAGDAAVLATVIHTEGSTYRRAGARLLVGRDGTAIGVVSGGCLEPDLVEHARAVLSTGDARRLRYDHARPDDLVWGLGLGCAGVVELFLERVDAAHPGPLETLRAWLDARSAGAIATRVGGPEPARRRTLRAGAAPSGDPTLAAHDAALAEALASGRPRLVPDAAAGDVAIEAFRPPPRLAIFGAGPDAPPLVAQAELLGWHVDVWDHRPEYARPGRFRAHTVVCTPAEDAVAAVAPTADTFAVVMTHHFLRDRTLLAALLASPCPYVAALGPRRRTEQLLREIDLEGGLPADAARRVFAPAGLDLGAEAPEEIALAIAAEIRAVASGRRGGPLGERKDPIH